MMTMESHLHLERFAGEFLPLQDPSLPPRYRGSHGRSVQHRNRGAELGLKG